MCSARRSPAARPGSTGRRRARASRPDRPGDGLLGGGLLATVTLAATRAVPEPLRPVASSTTFTRAGPPGVPVRLAVERVHAGRRHRADPMGAPLISSSAAGWWPGRGRRCRPARCGSPGRAWSTGAGRTRQ
ncbi:MAG: acyl-CoA thioesterase domain-containing protein [Ilumatobacteraceae bacterium]